MDAGTDPLNLQMQTQSLRQSAQPVFGTARPTARRPLLQGIRDSSRLYKSARPARPIASLSTQQAEVPRGRHITRLNTLLVPNPTPILLRVLYFRLKTYFIKFPRLRYLSKIKTTCSTCILPRLRFRLR